jgi:hypothetical protein
MNDHEHVHAPARDSKQRGAAGRFRRAERDVIPPSPRPARMPRDRGEAIGVVDRDDGKQTRIVWQKFADSAIGPVVALRLWTFVNGEPVPVAGAGLTFRVHEIPALVAALNTALARARRWAERTEAADSGVHPDADRHVHRGDDREGTSR